jgi:hypothetical protein
VEHNRVLKAWRRAWLHAVPVPSLRRCERRSPAPRFQASRYGTRQGPPKAERFLVSHATD